MLDVLGLVPLILGWLALPILYYKFFRKDKDEH